MIAEGKGRGGESAGADTVHVQAAEHRADGGPPAGEPALVVKGLGKDFPVPQSHRALQACHDVSFEVWAGESFGIVGESGSGKTTLGRCILRLIEPTYGRVIFKGADVTALAGRDLRALRREMRIVFQEPADSLNPIMPIGRQIAEPLRIHSEELSKADRRDRVVELLRLVGLPDDTADALPRALSGGEQQRCAIARAIATDPLLVVLDEPTSSLSPEAQADIMQLLDDLKERLRLSYIFISHDLRLVRSFCDRVAVMYLGQVVELATCEALFSSPQHPYTRALLGSILVPDPERRHDLRSAADRLVGEIPSPVDLPGGCYLSSRCPHVRDRCRREPQELRPLADGRMVRCWRAAEGELGPGAAVS